MPLYMYRALSEDGHIVRNKIEDSSKNAIIKKIKRNGLTPISVVQLKTKTQKNKKNINNVEQMLENLKTIKLMVAIYTLFQLDQIHLE